MTTRLTQLEISTTGNVIGNVIQTDNYQYANGSPFTGGNVPAYGNSNVATFMASFGSNTVSTTGNITSGYFVGNGSQLTGIVAVSSYGNSNVATLLSSFGSNTLSTTGNISGGYFVGNGSQLTGIVAVSSYGNSNVTTLLSSLGSNSISTTGNISGGYLFGTGNATISGIANTGISLQVNSFGTGLSNAQSGGRFAGSYISTGGSVSQGDGLAGLYGYGSVDGTNLFPTSPVFVELQAATSWSNTATPTHISFFVCGGASNVATRAVQINANGNLQIYNGNLSVANGNIVAGNIAVEDISAAGNVTASVALQLPVYANTTVRDNTIATPSIGMLVVVGNVYQGYNGVSWGNITLS